MEVLNVELKHGGYSEQKKAVQNINFSLSKGELVGLIGPNGAGKSTIIKAIFGLLEEANGEITLENDSKYAYIPEQPTYYEELTLWEHIELVKAVNNIGDEDFYERADQLLTIFRLQEEKHHFPTSFSKGMQQKLMIIIAILVKPSLYIVDEPFIGLDPKAIKDFIFILEEERKRGAAILMSTHVLDTAEKICDRFLLINHGELIASGTLDVIQDKSVPNGSLMDCFYHFMEKKL
ncbi:ABC transporter ATP-binding protein [Anaerobacillus isosaccharinicus]|uniref:ABC transporter ATP-binding protein n=1 Tax=Anaerobacillus isosaccharinicus TaxID=1532552 RepID=A0A1S2MDQ8_9BACI|nr:ABC transporter ATP-binding protein [Anaerobacillus isosaccharinicus]MBA5586698.1 ABC transporter ATP-binding protein [Anaerobacillus isosaccharinicus]QOY35075.1 ABC transporter ATP-binding protein [Anaerobacillus isosaccharinicus]